MIEEPRWFVNVELSPDGRFLALGVSGANETIWLYELARGDLTRFTFRFDNATPQWSPDGERLVFTSDRDGPFNLFQRAVNSNDPVERLATSDSMQFPGSWTPDGDSLVFAESRPGTGWDVWRLRLSDDRVAGDRVPEALLQEPYHERRPRLSPDGRWLAYVSDESGQNEVYIRSFPELGSKQKVSLDGGMDHQWSADGSELFFRNGDDLHVVEIGSNAKLEIGSPRLLFSRSFPGHSATPFAISFGYSLYDVTPDGQRFVAFEEEESEPEPTHLNLILNWAEELKRLVP